MLQNWPMLFAAAVGCFVMVLAPLLYSITLLGSAIAYLPWRWEGCYRGGVLFLLNYFYRKKPWLKKL